MRIFKAAAIVILTAAIILTTAYQTFPETYAATNVSSEEKGLISGIVKENNPSLGYLTLYFQDGSGSDPGVINKLTSLRNYTYGYEIPVLRDGLTVSTDSIQPGDQVFLKLDEDGTIARLSAKSFYKPVYGTVHLKSASGLIIKKDTGIYVHYSLSNSIPIYQNGRPGTLSDIVSGERVKLLVQTNGANVAIASIDIEKNPAPVAGIYRGSIEYFDSLRDALVLSSVQQFVNGRWENSSVIGIQSFGFSSEYKARPIKRVSGMAYVSVKKAPDGTKRIAFAAYRSEPGYETALRDNFLNLSNGLLALENSSDAIGYDSGTLVIKDGKLVDISALDTLDSIQVSMEKQSSGNKYLANVVVGESPVANGAAIYRGRIKSVDPTRSVTFESFAQLNGVTWNFTNTPKTFDINLAQTRFIDDGGVGNMRDFDSSRVGQSVYIIASGTSIELISTAPYADSPVSGRIQSFIGGAFDSFGEALTDPTGFKLTEASAYSTQDHQWNKIQDPSITVPVNAVVIKKGAVGSISLLKAGDRIKVMRHASTLNGMVIICD